MNSIGYLIGVVAYVLSCLYIIYIFIDNNLRILELIFFIISSSYFFFYTSELINTGIKWWKVWTQ